MIVTQNDFIEYSSETRGDLIARIKVSSEQIESMKCCGNCKYANSGFDKRVDLCYPCDDKIGYSEWEMRE